MLKKILLIILTLSTVICSIGCASKEQLAKLNAVEKQAKKNAVDYIYEKYGITVSAVDAKAHINNSSVFPSYDATGYATVTVQDDVKKFEVFITGEEQSTDGEDNYQQDTILEEAQKLAEDTFSFCKDKKYIDVYDGHDEYSDLYASTYYDGTNLFEVMSEMSPVWQYRVVTTGMDLQKIDTDAITAKFGTNADVMIINCKEDDDYQEIKDAYFFGYYDEIEDYAFYVDDYISFSSDKSEETEYSKLEVLDYDTFSVLLKDGTYCNVTETDIDPTDWEGHGYSDPRQIFGAYRIETDADTIYYYVETDRLDISDYSNVQIAQRYFNNDEFTYQSGLLTECINSQYLTQRFNCSDNEYLEFTVFIDR